VVLRLGGLAGLAELALVLLQALHDATSTRADAGAKLFRVWLAGFLLRLDAGLHGVDFGLARRGHLVLLALQALDDGVMVRTSGREVGTEGSHVGTTRSTCLGRRGSSTRRRRSLCEGGRGEEEAGGDELLEG